jgi:hypothetical protein
LSSFPGVTQLLILSRLPFDVFQIADAVVFMSRSGCWGRLCLSLTTVDSSVSAVCVDCLLTSLPHSWLHMNVSCASGTCLLVALSLCLLTSSICVCCDCWCITWFCVGGWSSVLLVFCIWQFSYKNSKLFSHLFITNLSFWWYTLLPCFWHLANMESVVCCFLYFCTVVLFCSYLCLCQISGYVQHF